MIKLTKLLFLLSLVIFLGSCDNDDDDSTGSAADLIGTWIATSFEYETSSSTSGSGIPDSEVMTEANGSNLNYELTFTQSNYTTSGSYDMTITATQDGNVVADTTQSYTNVTGAGTYSVMGDQITVGGSFFDFDVDGIDLSAFTIGDQTATYKITSDDKLEVTQDAEISSTVQGITSTSTIRSKSVWERQ